MLNLILSVYIDFKTVYAHESYLHCATIRNIRCILTQFRISAHSHLIERGRRDRICKICPPSIEDEYHFVIICDIYKDEGKISTETVHNIIASSKFKRSFSDSNEQIQTKLVLFLYHAMERCMNSLDFLNDNRYQ